jgi:benzoate-CoA ligase
VWAFLGTMKVGAVAVPLTLRAAPEDLRACLRDSQAKAAILDAEFLPAFRAVAEGLPERPIAIVNAPADRAGGVLSLAAFLAEQPDALDAEPMAPDDPAFWLYTSGTTGPAKILAHAQRNVLLADAYLRETLGVTAGMRLFATSKLFFAYALGTCLFGGFRLGATTVLHGAWPTPEGVRDAIAAHRPDIVFSVPALYRSVLRAGLAPAAPFRSVRTYVAAGEALPPDVYRSWRDATGREIVEGMGTSETIYMCLTNRPGDTTAGSAGFAAPGTELRLVDPGGQPIAAPDRPGELQVRMASTSRRTWSPQARVWTELPGQWFPTGDRFTFDARGRWWHQGRRDDLLRVGERWVNPAELEACALAMPWVADAAAIGVPRPDGTFRLVLYAVPAGAVGVTPAAGAAQEAALQNALRRALAERSALDPPGIEVRLVPELPRTASGKVERYRLRQDLAREAAPEREAGRGAPAALSSPRGK